MEPISNLCWANIYRILAEQTAGDDKTRTRSISANVTNVPLPVGVELVEARHAEHPEELHPTPVKLEPLAGAALPPPLTDLDD